MTTRIPGPAQRAGRSPARRPVDGEPRRLAHSNGKPVDPLSYLSRR
ncbi:hypothetical protein LDO32_12530 [Luteimonas sp. Y-2-2-4F]|nr:hypothetical protein [Luteimonas sp. Y-2-2-4F]MCD9032551.1 hypothetical protein [Luteimonas sp. Y-2-2-4F]